MHCDDKTFEIIQCDGQFIRGRDFQPTFGATEYIVKFQL